MASFQLCFQTDNAAFDHAERHLEIARILQEVATRVGYGDEHGTVCDVNGNRVGSFGNTGLPTRCRHRDDGRGRCLDCETLL